MAQEYDPLQGIGVSTRSFRVTGKDLRLIRGWDKRKSEPSAVIKSFNLYFSGKAESQKDGVRPKGSHEIIRQLELTLRSNFDAATRWVEIKTMMGLGTGEEKAPPETKLARLMGMQRDYFDENAPTAQLFFINSDRELGIAAAWHLECLFPQETFDQMAQDWENGLEEIILHIDWCVGFFEDPHAPPSFPSNWVPIRLTEKGPLEPMMGWVDYISWIPNRRNLR